jgi:hypothetical protein
MVDTGRIGAAPTALLQALGGGPLSRAEVQDRLGLNWRQTTNAGRSLLRRGLMAILADGRYRLTDEGRAAADRGDVITGGPKGQVKIERNTFRQRAWAAMRAQRSFTVGAIVAAAATPADHDPRDNAARYISRLRQAGFLAEERRRQPGTAAGSNGFKVYRLVRDPGPKAPIWREGAGCLRDPNSGGDIPCSPR